MPDPRPEDKLRIFRDALAGFVERLEEDHTILAAVLNGTLDDTTVWRKDGIGLWLIEVDGVTRRLRSDGEDERIWRTFTENGVNIHAELIERGRFKRMVEGSSRTAFSCNFFSKRELIYSADPSIDSWFDQANTTATKDQEKELLVSTTWAIHAHRYAKRVFENKEDLNLAVEALIWAAHSVASVTIVRHGEIYEHEIIYRALQHEPELFKVLYTDVIGRKPTKKSIRAALGRLEEYLEERAPADLRPLTRYLKKAKRVVPLSEIAEHFAHTQLYPWHLESACEWLDRTGRLEKVGMPFKITKKSRVEVEEPAYFLDS